LTALIAACSLEPGDYFKITTGKTQYQQLVSSAERNYHWELRPRNLDALKKEAGVKEDVEGRTGGAVPLAFGMAEILKRLPGMKSLIAYLYHFIVMFEALFILTLLETGTRVLRFILGELFATFRRQKSAAHEISWTMNIVTSLMVCAAWGYLTYQFDIARLWLLNGVSNQLLAVIGLGVGTTYLLRHASKRWYALCTAVPFALMAVTVFAAGGECVYKWWLRQGAPGLSRGDVFSYRLMCVLMCVIMLLGVWIIAALLRRWWVLLARGEAEAAVKFEAEELA
jgi:carbon starvation protein